MKKRDRKTPATAFNNRQTPSSISLRASSIVGDMLFGPQQGYDGSASSSMYAVPAPADAKRKDDSGKKRRSKNNNTSSLSPTTSPNIEGSGVMSKLVRPKDGRPSKNGRRGDEPSSMYLSVWNALKYKVVEKKATPASYLQATRSFMPICVTGIDDFLAAWIVSELLQRGYKVRGTVQSRKDDISRLYEIPNASTNLTVVETSLLTPESCDLAVEGCEYVIHTGTPSSCTVRDPLTESKDPPIHTISSRMHCIVPVMTNFIKACVRARIKKIVLSSSVAALCDSIEPSDVINDLNWNTVSSLEKNPHFLSLKVAEEKAWQLVEQEPKLDMVTICSGTLMGPAICNPSSIAPGNQVLYDLITGQYTALVDLNWALTDVRDCALAHILALEHNDARGRYICVNRTVWLREVVETLSANGYSGRALPFQVGLPNWVARLSSFSCQLGQVGASLYAETAMCTKPSPYQSDRIVDVLGLGFRDVKNTIVESAGDLLKWKYIKPWGEDREASACGCCQAPFNFLRRKHHCRECGVVICGDCSKSRAVVEGLDHPARLCDACVQSSIPALLDLMRAPTSCTKAVKALESLMENAMNHELITRCSGIPILLKALHEEDDDISFHAAGALLALSLDTASALQMVLEGSVLHMLEIDQTTETWRICLQALRNIWKQINRDEFRQMLHSVSRVSSDAAHGPLKSNILLTFVHMMEPRDVECLLKEGLLEVFFAMLKSADPYPRCAGAHAVVRLIPNEYDPDTTIYVPPYNVDDHEELLTLSTLSDIQFLVKGHIAPINAHKIVLFVRNAYFKNMFGSSSTATPKRVIEIDNCTYNVFSMILRFLYTGKLVIDDHSAQDLLRAASFYQVVELQIRIEKFLADRIAIENVVELLCLSNDCRAESLRHACIPFLLRHIHAVVKLPSFEAHREWASQEILLELGNILGPEWYQAYVDMMNHQKPHHAVATISSKPKAIAVPDSSSKRSLVSPMPSSRLLSPLAKPPRTRLPSEESLAEGIC
ncbi:Aste57867_20106 [Aphanomyces stellatus]|uniref:Aste57867_20106 protein n=1 Tax=Aphanomyces stellatus TaxID=120398 RepID=A0A485LFE4_9STRA|nr:hypothetical protein As57867_020040 [Aphanomyces stellatus]VFT96801.1 Aste57867_20106 [Aphanomyces stellatus]